MKESTSWNRTVYHVVLAFVIVIFLLLTYFFITNLKDLERNGAFENSGRPLHLLGKHEGDILLPEQADAIREWMTFSYVNRVFNLPDNYLKTELSIANIKYPNITIVKASKEAKVSVDAYLLQVKDTVHRYSPQAKVQE